MAEWRWVDGTCASRYDYTQKNAAIVRSRYDYVADLLPANADPVVDVGCAYGIGTETLQLAGYEVVGLDVDPQIVAMAAEEFPDVPFLVGDARDVEFHGHNSGYVLCDVLQHVPESRELLERIDDELEATLVGTTLERGHENIPEEREPRHPGLVTPDEIREILPDAKTWYRPTEDPDHRFWFEVKR